jgi:hypothetical protein
MVQYAMVLQDGRTNTSTGRESLNNTTTTAPVNPGTGNSHPKNRQDTGPYDLTE